MNPSRKKVIGTNKVEEYYWAGEMVVYVNNYLVDESFEDACKSLLSNETTTSGEQHENP